MFEAIAIITGFFGVIVFIGTIIEINHKGTANCERGDYCGLWVGSVLILISLILGGGSL